MGASVFRQKSLDRVSSPEQLNDYIRVSNPSIWMILIAVVALLVGVIAWGATGTLETTIDAPCANQGGAYVCYLTLDQFKQVKEALDRYAQTGEDMRARVNGEDRRVESVSDTPVSYDELAGSLEGFVMHRLGAAQGDYLYAVTLSGEADTNVADAQIVTEAVSPLSFILN